MSFIAYTVLDKQRYILWARRAEQSRGGLEEKEKLFEAALTLAWGPRAIALFLLTVVSTEDCAPDERWAEAGAC